MPKEMNLNNANYSFSKKLNTRSEIEMNKNNEYFIQKNILIDKLNVIDANIQLLDACKDNDIAKVNDLFLNDNININYQNNSGKTFLHIAYKNRNLEMFEKLLQKGINYKIKDNSNNSVLELMFNYKDTKFLELFINVLKVNVIEPLLKFSSKKRDNLITKLLILSGKKMNLISRNDILDIAISNLEYEILFFIKIINILNNTVKN